MTTPDPKAVLSSALFEPDPLVRAHSVWALGEIGSATALSALEALQPLESDPLVREELEAVLEGFRPNAK